MGKMTYNNRKIEGSKLSQIVTRDITKRIAPRASYKAALRDPVVEFDISSKSINDEGLKDISQALVEAIKQQDPGRALILEDVSFRDNNFSAIGVTSFSLVVRYSSSEIRNLDLSENSITVTTSEDALAFETFLKSFSHCTSLRRLDFRGNKLGRKGFEVLSKVWAAEVGVVVCEETGHATNCGLQSIPYICLADTGLDDLASTYLSYVLESHKFVNELLPFVPQARPGAQSHQLEAYDEVEGCNGIIWKPNAELGCHGTRVLELAEVNREARREMQGQDGVDDQLAQSVDDLDLSKSPRPRNDSIISFDDSFHITTSNFAGDLLRARSRIQLDALKNGGTAQNDLWISALKMLQYTRILLFPSDIMAQCTALAGSHRVLRASQKSNKHAAEQEIWPCLPSKPPRLRVPVLSLRLVQSGTPRRRVLSTGNPNISLTVRDPLRNGIDNLKPHRQAHDSNRRRLKETYKLVDQLNSEVMEQYTRPYRSKLLGGFSEYVWTEIIAYAADAEAVLSDNQKFSVIRWGAGRESMLMLQSMRGKHQSQQIYKALEGVGCLTYSI